MDGLLLGRGTQHDFGSQALRKPGVQICDLPKLLRPSSGSSQDSLRAIGSTHTWKFVVVLVQARADCESRIYMVEFVVLSGRGFADGPFGSRCVSVAEKTRLFCLQTFSLKLGQVAGKRPCSAVLYFLQVLVSHMSFRVRRAKAFSRAVCEPQESADA